MNSYIFPIEGANNFRKFLKTLSIFLTIFCIKSQPCFCGNGAIAYAYPIKNITVDGNLSDWPKDLKKYKIAHYRFNQKPTNSNDLQGYFRIGYNLKQKSLYVAVEVTDDIHIINVENPVWNAHDTHALFLDKKHNMNGSSVFAFEANEYSRNIPRQEAHWDPEVRNLTTDDFDVKIFRNGINVTYEWRIDLEAYLVPGNTIGFDYIIFDKDDSKVTPEAAPWGFGGYGITQIAWGFGNELKLECSNCLGDILLMPKRSQLVTLEGKIRPKKLLPKTIRLESQINPGLWVDTRVDSLGNYRIKLPVGHYNLNVPSTLFFSNGNAYRVTSKNESIMNIGVDGEMFAPDHETIAESSPDLIAEKGLLHDEFDQNTIVKIDDFITSYQKFYGIPGVSLGIIKDGKLVYHQTYGVSNSITKAPVDNSTLFEGASVTKALFAYVVNRLSERGVIDLDKPLSDYLAFKELEQFPEYRIMTGRHVLSHRSGLPNWGKNLKFTPGTQYGYSGEAFEYLKRVLEQITGKGIEQILDEEIMGPMGISHMQFSESENLQNVVATGHVNEQPTVRPIPKEVGVAYSMYTESKEFSKFVMALIQREGLSQSTYKDMLQIQSEIPLDVDEPSMVHRKGMGLGIGVKESTYGKIFYHGGSNGDFKCEFRVFDDLKMGYIVFTNSNTGNYLHWDLEPFLISGKE